MYRKGKTVINKTARKPAIILPEKSMIDPLYYFFL